LRCRRGGGERRKKRGEGDTCGAWYLAAIVVVACSAGRLLLNCERLVERVGGWVLAAAWCAGDKVGSQPCVTVFIVFDNYWGARDGGIEA